MSPVRGDLDGSFARLFGHDIDISVLLAARSAVVSVRGEVDIESAPILQAALGQMNPGRHVLMDLRGVTFIDSSGLSVLASEAARMRRTRGSLCIRKASPVVRRAIEGAGVDALL